MSNDVYVAAKRRIVGAQIRKSVLLYMAEVANHDGSGIWISKTTMAADLETTARSVQRHIGDLVDMGVLRIDGQRPKIGGGYTVEYSIVMDVLGGLPSTRKNPVRPGDDATRSRGAVRQGVTPRGDSVSPKPPIEPSDEPSITPQPPVDLLGDPVGKPLQDPVKLPPDWVPNEKNIQYAVDKGLTHEEIREQADDFQIYWTEGKGAKQKRTPRGWDSAWRNRITDRAPSVIRARNMASNPRPGYGGRGGSIADEVARRRMRDQDQN